MKIHSITFFAAVALLVPGTMLSNATLASAPAPKPTKTAPALPPKADKFQAVLDKMNAGQANQVSAAELRDAIQETSKAHAETVQKAATAQHPGASAKAEEHLDEVHGHLADAEKEVKALETAKTENEQKKAREHAALHIGFARLQVDAGQEAAKNPNSPIAKAASSAAEIATTQAKQVKAEEKAKK